MNHSKLSPQKQYLYNLLKDGGWVCSNSIDPFYVRDYRKRLSEMLREGFKIESEICHCERKHRAGVHKYRLVEAPTRLLWAFDLVNGIRVPRKTYITL
jgi:hypothetical protein